MKNRKLTDREQRVIARKRKRELSAKLVQGPAKLRLMCPSPTKRRQTMKRIIPITGHVIAVLAFFSIPWARDGRDAYLLAVVGVGMLGMLILRSLLEAGSRYDEDDDFRGTQVNNMLK